jgi:hypothetical protein
MQFTIVTLCMVLMNLAGALFVPRQSNYGQLGQAHGFARRNDTMAMSGELDLNIDPDIVNPSCGSIFEANINVETSPDPFYLSTACQNILSYIGGIKGNKDVDVVFACTGESIGTALGTGDRPIKVILNIAASAAVNGANGGTQLVPSNLELVNEQDNTFVSTQVNLGVKMSGSKVTFQFIYC